VETAAFIGMAVVHSSALRMEDANSSQILYQWARYHMPVGLNPNTSNFIK